MVWSNALEPRVCVVMPAFRAADTVAAAARTILGQDYGNLVLGIGVPTRDPETMAAVRNLNDPRVILVEQTGRGISDGRNEVLKNIPADLYMFLDADDFMMPGVVSAYVRHRIETGVPGLRCGHYVRGLIGDPKPVEMRRVPFLGRVHAAFARMCVMGYVTTGSAMIDREVVEKAGLFDTRYDHAEDWHYWLRVSRAYPVFGLDIVAYHYTYAKLACATPFPRTFFDDGHRVIRDIAPPVGLRLLAHLWIRAQYAVYYLRTIRIRRRLSEYLDVRIGDFLSLAPAGVLFLLRRLRLM